MLCCPHSNVSSRNHSYSSSLIELFIVSIIVITLFAAVSARASTGYPDEIYNIGVQNQTPTTVDIVWDTIHPSNSQVVIARDQNYQGERRIVSPDARLLNHHRVTVDRLMPYDPNEGMGSYYFYVASTDVNGVTSTTPGPYDGVTGDPKTYLLPLQTAPPAANGKSNYAIYTHGPTNVYAGSDLYFAVQIAQLAGSHPSIYVHNQTGYNNGSDGVVKAATMASARILNPKTISVHLECYEYNPNNSDADDQYYDPNKNMGLCWNFEYHLMTVRLRTSANTVRGNYSVTITLQDNGQDVSTTYNFAVLPAATAPVAHDSYPRPIPGLAQWESNMTQLGHKYCDSTTYKSSRDMLNAAGSFLTGWGWEGDAWYYDGGRVYQQIASYTNDPSWNHCALTILDPYRQYLVANNGNMPLYAIFAWGMAMNYWRTGEQSNADALQALGTKNGGANYGGWVDPYYIRESAYGADVRIANELITKQRDRLLSKNIDKLLGHLDMVYKGQLGAAHPFMVGLAMETLIHYYDMTVAQGHPDYRVPEVVKRALDALWRDYYVPGTHAFRYTRADLPTTDNWNVLNDTVAPAYAWYWSVTGDAASLSRGDELFQHVFDVPGQFDWCGKQFSQMYKWSFDFVRWRSGQGTSTTIADNNPLGGPYADTEPPIEWQVALPNITQTSATITWKTYEPADSQIVYGVSAGYYPLQSVLLDTGAGMKQVHSVTLTGLTPGTTYHYRIDSHDAANNLASLADATFTTSGDGQGGGGGGTLNGGGSGGLNGMITGDSDLSLSGNDSNSGTGTTSASGDASAGASSGPRGTSHSNAYSSKTMLMQ